VFSYFRVFVIISCPSLLEPGLLRQDNLRIRMPTSGLDGGSAMTWRKGLQLVLLGGLAIINAGCLAVAAVGAAGAGAATYVYLKGRYSEDYPANFKDSYYGVIACLDDLKYPVLSQTNNGTTGTFTSKTEDGTTITVDLTTEAAPAGAPGSVTRIGVRVGSVLGDQAVSERILAKLQERLVPGSPTRPGEPKPVVATGGQKGPGNVIQPVGWTYPGETAPPPELPADPMPVRKP
jgi:hypothetical protein